MVLRKRANVAVCSIDHRLACVVVWKIYDEMTTNTMAKRKRIPSKKIVSGGAQTLDEDSPHSSGVFASIAFSLRTQMWEFCLTKIKFQIKFIFDDFFFLYLGENIFARKHRLEWFSMEKNFDMQNDSRKIYNFFGVTLGAFIFPQHLRRSSLNKTLTFIEQRLVSIYWYLYTVYVDINGLNKQFFLFASTDAVIHITIKIKIVRYSAKISGFFFLLPCLGSIKLINFSWSWTHFVSILYSVARYPSVHF